MSSSHYLPERRSYLPKQTHCNTSLMALVISFVSNAVRPSENALLRFSGKSHVKGVPIRASLCTFPPTGILLCGANHVHPMDYNHDYTLRWNGPRLSHDVICRIYYSRHTTTPMITTCLCAATGFRHPSSRRKHYPTFSTDLSHQFLLICQPSHLPKGIALSPPAGPRA